MIFYFIIFYRLGSIEIEGKIPNKNIRREFFRLITKGSNRNHGQYSITVTATFGFSGKGSKGRIFFVDMKEKIFYNLR